jgi:hypothetical protein
MKITTLLTILSTTLTTAATSVLINATTSGLDKPSGGSQIISATLYTLNTYPNLAVTKLALVADQAVDPDDVECRMYKDAQGLQPGSLPFSGDTVAYVSTNTVEVGAIACYAIGDIAGN